MRPHRKFVLITMLFSSGRVIAQDTPTTMIEPRLATTPVNYRADDPAIWIHPTMPDSSLILGTDIGTYPNGGLFVWNPDGSQQQRIIISHPEHIDLRYGIQLGNELVDVAVVAMRDHDELRAYRIDPQKRMLEDITSTSGIRVLRQPFGLGLYKRKSDGALFATVSGRTSSTKEGVVQYRLEDDGSGFLQGTEVRTFGDNAGYVDGILSDDALGYLYLAEEDSGVHKYYADPDRGDERLGLFAGRNDFNGNRGGLALYGCSDSTGYLLVANRANNAAWVYRRQGESDSPHYHPLVGMAQNLFEEAGDGIDVANFTVSESFPNGFFVWVNKTENNFQFYAWEDVATDFLNVCTQGKAPTSVGQGRPVGERPEDFALHQNYPNPFNPETEITFQVPSTDKVKLSVRNLLGQAVRTLVNRELPPGVHVARWDGIDHVGQPVASGIYIYQLQITNYLDTKRMVLLR